MLKGRFLTNNILHACQQTTRSCVLAEWCMLTLQHDGNQTAPHRWTSAASKHYRAGASALAANSAMHACTLTRHSPGGNRWLRALAAAAAMMKALPDQAWRWLYAMIRARTHLLAIQLKVSAANGMQETGLVQEAAR